MDAADMPTRGLSETDNIENQHNSTSASVDAIGRNTPVYLRSERRVLQEYNLQTTNNLAHKQDNFWSTSLYSQPPLLTSSRCSHALTEFVSDPPLLAVATEASSHPNGLQSVLAQPWLYAGGGLGNIPECPLQVCLAGAGTRRDSITFASVCVPYECHAQDLAAHDFLATLQLAVQSVNNREHTQVPHSIPGTKFPPYDSLDFQQEWQQEYITLHSRIATLNEFLQTGWTCGSFQVPWHAFPFGLPYLLVCAFLVTLSLRGTFWTSKKSSNKSRAKTFVFVPPSGGEPNAVLKDLKRQTSRFTESETMSTGATPSSRLSENVDSSSAESLSSVEATEPATDNPNSSGQIDDNAAANNNNGATVWNLAHHWQALCSTRHESTAFLDGFRFLSIIWVILGHVMAIQSSTGGGYSNPVDFLPPSGLTTTFLGQLIFASRFAVDTFLCISGYLVVVVLHRKAPALLSTAATSTSAWPKARTFFQLVGLRLLRIMPLYAMCLGFYTQVAPHMYLVGANQDGGGPFWYQWESLLYPCREYGWTNFLFVNNFIPFGKSNTETCFYHSWYLAVDMQLFVLVGLPMTYFIFLDRPVWGRRLTLLLWFISVMLTAYLSYVRHWSINTFDGSAVSRFDAEAYAKPHVRGQAYLAGMYVAMWQLTKSSNNGSRASARWWRPTLAMWMAIGALGFVTFITVTGAYARRPCQYGEGPMTHDCGSLWSPTFTFLYTASSRAIWSCCIAVLMVLCLEGKGGWLNQFLSWPVWAPLAQLSFGAYLIHPIVIFVWLLGERQKEVYSLATFCMSLVSVCVVSFGWALVACLLVEFPMAALLSQKVKRGQRKSSGQPSAEGAVGETAKLLSTSANEKRVYGSN